jgi:hypothetical protein
MIPNFAEILSQHTNDIEAPKALPAGQYEAAIDGLPEQEHLGPDKSPALVFKVSSCAPSTRTRMKSSWPAMAVR